MAEIIEGILEIDRNVDPETGIMIERGARTIMALPSPMTQNMRIRGEFQVEKNGNRGGKCSRRKWKTLSVKILVGRKSPNGIRNPNLRNPRSRRNRKGGIPAGAGLIHTLLRIAETGKGRRIRSARIDLDQGTGKELMNNQG